MTWPPVTQHCSLLAPTETPPWAGSRVAGQRIWGGGGYVCFEYPRQYHEKRYRKSSRERSTACMRHPHISQEKLAEKNQQLVCVTHTYHTLSATSKATPSHLTSCFGMPSLMALNCFMTRAVPVAHVISPSSVSRSKHYATGSCFCVMCSRSAAVFPQRTLRATGLAKCSTMFDFPRQKVWYCSYAISKLNDCEGRRRSLLLVVLITSTHLTTHLERMRRVGKMHGSDHKTHLKHRQSCVWAGVQTRRHPHGSTPCSFTALLDLTK